LKTGYYFSERGGKVMKRIIKVFTAAAFMALLMTLIGTTVYANTSATIGTNRLADGIVTVTLSGHQGKTIKAQVTKGGDTYTYDLNRPSSNLPLQMGVGEYKITVVEGIGGNKFKVVTTQNVTAASINETAMFTASIPLVEHAASSTAIPAFKNLTNAKTAAEDKASTIHKNVVETFSYDTKKAASVQSGYVPVIDTVFAAKSGICYDYASVFAGALRSQGVPTRLVMGYMPGIEEYHAWNEVLIGGSWVAVDSTFDSQLHAAGRPFTMRRDRTKTKVLRTY
jgi:hypothetical protein